jgi:membrane fusion protein (multidrug efflux system)
MKKLLFSLFAPLLLAACHDIAEQPVSEPITEVSFMLVEIQDHVVKKHLTGRTSAYRVSEVRPQVSGIIRKRTFEEGSLVQADQVLYEINAESYQALYEQAKAQLALSQASLVNLDNNVRRYKKLLNTNGVSQQDYDEALAIYQQGLAKLAFSKAELESASINLKRTRITAPITGRIGRSNVTEGALVSDAQITPLATIQQLDPIYVDIVQASQQLIGFKRRIVEGGLQPASSSVRLIMEDGYQYPYDGTMKFSEVNVDPSTGAVTLRAEFPNADNLLLPGMYVRAQIEQGIERGVALVPKQAVQYNHDAQPIAFVIDESDQVQERTLTVLNGFEDRWVVGSGLAAGDRLIVEGLQRIHAGMRVEAVVWQEAATDNNDTASLISVAE